MVQRFTVIIAALLLFPALAMSQATVLQGTVEKIDKNSIVLRTDSGQENVELNSSTKGMDKAKVGDKVTISATKSGNKLVASSINASKGGSQRSAPSAGPADSPSSPPISPRGLEDKRPGGMK
jgi:hypothetical protein